MTGPVDLPVNPTLRALGKQIHARYTLAARIARATWPANETSPEAMVAATATVFIEMSKSLAANVPPARPGGAPDQPQPCSICGRAMRDQRTTKRGNQPDYKCTPPCDGAVWLDRKRAR